MYTCVYVYMYIDMYMYKYAWMYVNKCQYACTCMCVRVPHDNVNIYEMWTLKSVERHRHAMSLICDNINICDTYVVANTNCRVITFIYLISHIL